MSYDEEMYEIVTSKRSTERKRPKKKHSYFMNEGYAEKIRKKQERIDREQKAKGLPSKWSD